MSATALLPEILLVAEKGLMNVAVSQLPLLYALTAVRQRTETTSPAATRQALRTALLDAADRLGEADAEASKARLGLTSASRLPLQKDRRKLAAGKLFTNVDHFRKHLEKPLLANLADELSEMENEAVAEAEQRRRRRGSQVPPAIASALGAAAATFISMSHLAVAMDEVLYSKMDMPWERRLKSSHPLIRAHVDFLSRDVESNHADFVRDREVFNDRYGAARLVASGEETRFLEELLASFMLIPSAGECLAHPGSLTLRDVNALEARLEAFQEFLVNSSATTAE